MCFSEISAPPILGLCVTQNYLLTEYKTLFYLIFLFIVRTFNAMVARSNRARHTIKDLQNQVLTNYRRAFFMSEIFYVTLTSEAQEMWMDTIISVVNQPKFNIKIGDMNYVLGNMIAKYVSSSKHYRISNEALSWRNR
jgi:radical SAM superfamily enzyme